jgi:hypothetical protein
MYTYTANWMNNSKLKRPCNEARRTNYLRLVKFIVATRVWGLDAQGCPTFVGSYIADMIGYKVEKMQAESLFELRSYCSSTMLNSPPFVLSLSKDSRITLRQAQRERFGNVLIA